MNLWVDENLFLFYQEYFERIRKRVIKGLQQVWGIREEHT